VKDESRFWDRIAKKYYQTPVKDQDAYEKKLEITRSYFQKDMKVLEFGCGTGSTAVAHAPFVEQITAIDISQNMLDYADEQARAAGVDNVRFRKGSIETFDAEVGSFDVIMGMSVLHLVDDREAVLNKVMQLLKPGGVFISSTACMGDKLKFLKYIIPIGRAVGLLPLVRFFTQQQLVDDLENSGFRIDRSWLPDGAVAVFIVASKEQVVAGIEDTGIENPGIEDTEPQASNTGIDDYNGTMTAAPL
jgi:ubiquinone/menaquinone biosynthesis C-methylase UbiE